jgi:hypothetical protein
LKYVPGQIPILKYVPGQIPILCQFLKSLFVEFESIFILIFGNISDFRTNIYVIYIICNFLSIDLLYLT